MATVDVAEFNVDISLTGSVSVDVAEFRVDVSNASPTPPTVDVAEFQVNVTPGVGGATVDVADFEILIGNVITPPSPTVSVDVAEFLVNIRPGGPGLAKTGAYVQTADGQLLPINPWTRVSA